MSDERTLRLASITLTEGLLERYVTYQRVLLTGLPHAEGDDWAGRYAFAHGRAFTESGLDGLELQQIKALVGEFCGRRWAWLRVKQKVAEYERALSDTTHAGDSPAKIHGVLANARRELPRMADFTDFAARYSEETLALLRARELELVTLHQDLVRAEGTGGHLHGEQGG